jgi:hypothetical protein
VVRGQGTLALPRGEEVRTVVSIATVYSFNLLKGFFVLAASIPYNIYAVYIVEKLKHIELWRGWLIHRV